MLERLLNEIKASGTIQTTLLADRLGTSVTMVEMMINDLKRRGLLNEVNLSCSTTGGSACGGCPFAGSCGAGGTARVWQVTQHSQ
jgi:hypothetical protein